MSGDFLGLDASVRTKLPDNRDLLQRRLLKPIEQLTALVPPFSKPAAG